MKGARAKRYSVGLRKREWTGLISGHSLRVGSAVSLADAGATMKEVQRAGRWQEPTMPARYVREGADGTECGGEV